MLWHWVLGPRFWLLTQRRCFVCVNVCVKTMLVSYFSLTVLKILIGIGAVCWQHQFRSEFKSGWHGPASRLCFVTGWLHKSSAAKCSCERFALLFVQSWVGSEAVRLEGMHANVPQAQRNYSSLLSSLDIGIQITH